MSDLSGKFIRNDSIESEKLTNEAIQDITNISGNILLGISSTLTTTQLSLSTSNEPVIRISNQPPGTIAVLLNIGQSVSSDLIIINNANGRRYALTNFLKGLNTGQVYNDTYEF